MPGRGLLQKFKPEMMRDRTWAVTVKKRKMNMETWGNPSTLWKDEEQEQDEGGTIRKDVREPGKCGVIEAKGGEFQGCGNNRGWYTCVCICVKSLVVERSSVS